MLALSVVVIMAVSGTPMGDHEKGPKAVKSPGIARSRVITKRLAAFIVKTQPRAKGYAKVLARRIVLESRAHGLDPAIMAAIAWIESDYRTRARNSRDGSHGLWQLMARDSYMSRAWAELRRAGRTAGYPAASWWRIGARNRIRAMRDIRLSTYMAHVEIREAIRICKRMGHRVSRWRSSFGAAPPRLFHRDRLERYGHFNSGNRWPLRRYIRALRHRTKLIRNALSE